MGITTYIGTGRANCGECGKVIKKNERGVEAWSSSFPQKLCIPCVLKALGLKGKAIKVYQMMFNLEDKENN